MTPAGIEPATFQFVAQHPVTVSGIYSLRAIRNFIYEPCFLPFSPLNGGEQAKFQVLSHKNAQCFKLLKTTDWFKKVLGLLGCDAVPHGWGFPKFRRNIVPSSPSAEGSNVITLC